MAQQSGAGEVRRHTRLGRSSTIRRAVHAIRVSVFAGLASVIILSSLPLYSSPAAAAAAPTSRSALASASAPSTPPPPVQRVAVPHAATTAQTSAPGSLFASAGTNTPSAPSGPGSIPPYNPASANPPKLAAPPQPTGASIPLRPGEKLAPTAVAPIGSQVQGGKVVGADSRFVLGQSTEVVSSRTANSQTYANTDGTRTQFFNTAPIFAKGSDGSWTPMDSTLIPNGSGRVNSVTNDTSASFSTAASTTGGSGLASLSFDAGHSISFSLANASATSQPTLAGSTATYKSVEPNTDLALTSQTSGIKESIVLNSAAAPTVFDFPLTTKGLMATADPTTGGISFSDSAGIVLARIPKGWMEDSKIDPHSQLGAQSSGVTEALVPWGSGGQAVEVTLDKSWLADPARQFPVTVDPSIITDSDATYIDSAYPGQNYAATNDLHLGTWNGGVSIARIFLHFSGVNALAGDNITSALLDAWNAQSYSCNARTSSAYQITTSWTGSLTTWAAQPGIDGSTWDSTSQTQGYSGCPSGWDTWDVTNYVSGWAKGSPNNGISLRTDEADDYSYKHLTGESGPAPPQLAVTYFADVAPGISSQVPANGASLTSLSTSLQIGGFDPDNFPGRGLQYDFNMCSDAAMTQNCFNSNWISSSTWSPTLAWNSTYYWTGQTYDTELYSQISSPVSFSTIIPQPTPGGHLGTDSYSANNGGVNIATGNYFTQATDASVLGIGPALKLVRSYNSQNTIDAGFGPGWSQSFGATATQTTTPPGVLITSGDGHQEQFVTVGSTYLGPVGYQANLRTVGTGLELTQEDGSSVVFDNLGRLVEMGDAQGHVLNLTYSGSTTHINVVTNGTNNRTLTFTWTGSDITKIATQSINGSPIVWTYAYSSGSLQSACVNTTPTATCTTYAAGSDNGNAVLGKITRPSGKLAVTLSYDGSGKGIVSTRIDGATPPNTWSYAYTTNANGSASRTVTEPALNGTAHTVGYSFDPFGRQTTITNEDGNTKKVAYDELGNLNVSTDANGNSVFLTHDSMGRVLSHTTYQSATSINGQAAGKTVDFDAGTLADAGLTNASFESGFTPWAATGGENTAVDAGSAADGSYYLETNASAAGGSVYQDVPTTVVQGHSYRESMYLREATAGHPVSVSLELWALGNTPSEGWVNSVTVSSTSWTRYSVDLDVANANHNDLRFQVYVNTPGGQNIDVDGATLQDSGLLNSSFDDPNNHGFDHWNRYVGNENYAVKSGGAAEDASYLETNVPTANGSIYQDVAMSPLVGHSYVASMMLRSLTGAPIQVGITLWGIGGTTDVGQTLVTVSSTSWTRYSVNLDVANANHNELRLQFYLVTTGQNLDIDAASLLDAGLFNASFERGTTDGWVSSPGFSPTVLTSSAPEGSNYIEGTTAAGSDGIPANTYQDVGVPLTQNHTYTASMLMRSPSGAPVTVDLDLWAMGGGSNLVGYTAVTVSGTSWQRYSVSVDVNATGYNNLRLQPYVQPSVSEAATTTYTYPTGPPTGLVANDPRLYRMLSKVDPIGNLPQEDPRLFTTTYGYNQDGQLTSQTSPVTTACPTGCATNWVYSVGSEPAVGGGQEPQGLLLTQGNPNGGNTTYRYFSNGDLAQVTDPAGLVKTYTYDAVGRQVTETETSDSYPAGLITSTTYDPLNRTSTITGPLTYDAVTNTSHQKVTTYTYDLDSDLQTQKISDATGHDATSRTTTYGYDSADRVQSVTDPLNRVTNYTYDALSNMATKIMPNGASYAYSYTPESRLASESLTNFVDNPVNPGSPRAVTLTSYTYDPAGRLASVTDAGNRTTDYTYNPDDTVASVTMPNFVGGVNSTPRTLTLHTYEYNANGDLLGDTIGDGSNNQQKTSYTYDGNGKMLNSEVDLTGLDRTTTNSYDADGNLIQSVHSAAGTATTETTATTYDLADRTLTTKVALGSGWLTTILTRDQRGVVTSETDPNGNVTHVVSDQTGAATTVTAPTVAETTAPAPNYLPVTANGNPVTTTGYDTFGDVVHTKDPNGNIKITGYDADGEVTSVASPAYTPPGGTLITPTVTYSNFDGLGNPKTITDGRGNPTNYVYDLRGRLYQQTDPTITGQSAAGVTTTTYNDTNTVASVTNPTGAKTTYAYDFLDRQVTQSVIERTPTSATYTTSATYDDLGDQTSITTPPTSQCSSGCTTMTSYDAAGDPTQSTDPGGNIWKQTYDLMGRPVTATSPPTSAAPSGMSTTNSYDTAGRLTQVVNAAGTTGYGFDNNGNSTTVTPPSGHATVTAYDALNRASTITTPVSATVNDAVTFGYDAASNRTLATDPKGNATISTYNSLNLPESVIEPSTTAFPNAGDRTTTTSYDANGNPVKVVRPGGVNLNSTYNQMNWLTSETGSGGATSTTLARTLGYDLAGEVTSFATPSGSQSVGYNDRGNVVSSSGPEGSAAYTYNADDQLTQRTDASGTANFSWTPTGHVATASDPLTGSTRAYTYDGAGENTQMSYGTGKAVQTVGYDSAGRESSNVLATSGGTTLYSLGYTYDPNSNVASTTVGPTGVAGYGTSSNAYTYDWANELLSWTNTSGALTNYTYDQAGNRTAAGSTTFVYDQRNRLTSSTGTPATSYAYTARGTLLSSVTGAMTTNYAADAFDRVTTAGTSTYSYDSLDRIATANGNTFSYAGTESGVVSDGTKLYARGPTGQLLAEGTSASNAAVVNDIHGDIVATLTPSATSLTSSANFDPFGNVTAIIGIAPGSIGFQGEWSDKTAGTNGLVSMGSRFYSPGIGQFISQDTAPLPVSSGIGMNDYAYVGNGPLLAVDPTGHNAQHTALSILDWVDGESSPLYSAIAWDSSRFVDIIGGIYDAVAGFAKRIVRNAALLGAAAAIEFGHGIHWIFENGNQTVRSGSKTRTLQRPPGTGTPDDGSQPLLPTMTQVVASGCDLSVCNLVENPLTDSNFGFRPGCVNFCYIPNRGPAFGEGLCAGCNFGGLAGPAPGTSTDGLQAPIHPTPGKFTESDATNPAGHGPPLSLQGAECADNTVDTGGGLRVACLPENPSPDVHCQGILGNNGQIDPTKGYTCTGPAPQAGVGGSGGKVPPIPPGLAFHYTGAQNVSSIEANGLRAGSYATPNGELSPLQAQIDLALPPNRGLPGAVIRVDVEGLRAAGYDIPGVSRVGRSFNMPGGGFEMQFPYPIPPEFLKVVP
jgi:RHS repeat-associated protein